jgi:hypothetical protein
MMAKYQLPNEVLWDADHASDLALSAITDGEDSLLAPDVVAHTHSCDACTMRLGTLALETHGVTNAVESVKPWLPAALLVPSKKAAPSKKASSSQPVPLPAIFGALALTAVGATPTVLAFPHRIAELILTLEHAAPAMSHGGLQVIQQGVGVAAMGVCALLLVAAGVAVTRVLPRPASS